MATCNINSLLDSGRCFSCLSSGELDIIELQLLCEILGGTSTTPSFSNIFLTNPQAVSAIFEEFNSGNVASATVGSNGWIFTAIGAGGGVSAVSGTFGYPQMGVARLFSTQNAAGETIELSLSGQAGLNTALTRTWDITWVGNVNATANFQLYFGLGDGGAALQTNGIGFRFDTTLGDTTWVAYMMNTSVQSAVSTGVAVETTSFHTFRMVCNGAGTVTYYIDGIQVATRTSGGPANATFLKIEAQLLSVGAVTNHWNMDYFSYQERLVR